MEFRVFKAPIDIDVEQFTEMENWCARLCENSTVYIFPQNDIIDEPAMFWFEDELDALAFQIRYNFVEECHYEFERKC